METKTESPIKESIVNAYKNLKSILQRIKEDEAKEDEYRTFELLSEALRDKPVWYSRKAALESCLFPFLMRRQGFSNLIEFCHVNRKSINYQRGRELVISEGENLLKIFESIYPELVSQTA
jgi:site-specific DNA-adenine methylase